jgi:hypothetical protein
MMVDKMIRACNIHGRDEKCTKKMLENLKERTREI